MHAPVKVDNDLYVRDYAKCILCYKCVDACGEQYQNTFAIAVAGRGFDARISTEYANPLPDSACVYCGNCIAVCPTGALMFATEYELREDGSWDESRQTQTDTICPYCGVGCNLTLHVQDNQIVKVTLARRPRHHARQPLHQGPLRLPARAHAAGRHALRARVDACSCTVVGGTGGPPSSTEPRSRPRGCSRSQRRAAGRTLDERIRLVPGASCANAARAASCLVGVCSVAVPRQPTRADSGHVILQRSLCARVSAARAPATAGGAARRRAK